MYSKHIPTTGNTTIGDIWSKKFIIAHIQYCVHLIRKLDLHCNTLLIIRKMQLRINYDLIVNKYSRSIWIEASHIINSKKH